MYYFIVNPTAGNGKIIPIFNALRQYLTQKNILGECIKTASQDDTKNLAKIAQKRGYSTVVAVGGDGTVNEVLQAIAGSNMTLGVLPFGISNMFAQNIGIPLQWKKAVDAIASRKVRLSAVGKILETKTYFIHSLQLVCVKPKKSLFTKSHLFHPHIEVDTSFTLSSLCHEVSLELGDYQNAFTLLIKNDKEISRLSCKVCRLSNTSEVEVFIDRGRCVFGGGFTAVMAPFRQRILVG